MKGRFILRAKEARSSDTEVKISHRAATPHPGWTRVKGVGLVGRDSAAHKLKSHWSGQRMTFLTTGLHSLSFSICTLKGSAALFAPADDWRIDRSDTSPIREQSGWSGEEEKKKMLNHQTLWQKPWKIAFQGALLCRRVFYFSRWTRSAQLIQPSVAVPR